MTVARLDGTDWPLFYTQAITNSVPIGYRTVSDCNVGRLNPFRYGLPQPNGNAQCHLLWAPED